MMSLKRSFKLILLLTVWAVVFNNGLLLSGPSSAHASADSYLLPKERFILPNGLTAVVVEKKKLPLVHMQLLVRAGSLHEPEEKAGLANLTGRLLDKGTSSKTAFDIAESLDLIGASLSVNPGKSATTIDLSVLVKDVEEALGIFRELLVDPAFREDEVEREKKKVLSEMAQKKDSPRSLVQEAMLETVYGGHAMGRPIEGYEDVVPGITAGDIRDFYKRHYLPNNSILVMVADMSTEAMRALVERYFGSSNDGWRAGPLPSFDLPPPGEEIGKKVRLIDKDINQSYVSLGMISLRRVNPDYNALRVMNYIMGGGGFVSRLLKRIRSEEGLAYSAYSYVVPGSLFKGYYVVALQTKISSTSRAMNLMLEVMEGMKEGLVTEQELAEAKSFYRGSLARRMETYADVAGLMMNQEFYGLPDYFYLKDIEEIESLSREDINRVARKYIHLDNFNVAVVTRVKDLRLEVEGIEESMVERLDK